MAESGNGQKPTNGRWGVHFDPTIKLGDLLTGAAFLVAGAGAYFTLDARMMHNAIEIKRVETTAEKTVGKAEVELGRRINEERTLRDQTQIRTAMDVQEIKTIMRDGFRDLDTRLDRKADKPGR